MSATSIPIHSLDDPRVAHYRALKDKLLDREGKLFIAEGENVVGRAPDAAVWIDARGVSRHHARIVVARGAATVEDLGSKNGTYVGAQRVTAPRALADGEQIRLGSVVLTFRVPQPPGATETQPAP